MPYQKHSIFLDNILFFIWKLERFLIKWYRQNLSLLFNKACLNERLLPYFTKTYIHMRAHTHTHTHTHTKFIKYVPDFFRMGTFIDSTRMKHKSTWKYSPPAAKHSLYCSNTFWKVPWKSSCVSVSMTFVTASFISSVVS